MFTFFLKYEDENIIILFLGKNLLDFFKFNPMIIDKDYFFHYTQSLMNKMKKLYLLNYNNIRTLFL